MIKNSIVLVPFPFDDYSNFKVRPALCLTSEIGKHQHIIIAFISSKNPEESLESDLAIGIPSKAGANTGPFKDSWIRLHKLVTIPKSFIKRKLGVVNKQTEAEIVKKIKLLLLE